MILTLLEGIGSMFSENIRYFWRNLTLDAQGHEESSFIIFHSHLTAPELRYGGTGEE
jgi:hypothetical protein